MKPTILHKLAFGLAILLLAAGLFLVSQGRAAETGPFFISGLLALAVAARGLPATKGFSYTICIFTAVTAAMFHPEHFRTIGDFQLKTLITPLLQIIMFGMGSQMSFSDFTGVIKMPKGVIIGVIAHYMIMPLVAFGIASLFDFPPEIKAGIILIGCVPSGLASNVMSFIAGANLALAVTIGAISTLLSPLVTPLLMKLLGGSYIEVDFWKMMLDIINMIILPIVAGFIFNLFVSTTADRKSKVVQMVSFPLVILLAAVVFLIARRSALDVAMQAVPAMDAAQLQAVAKTATVSAACEFFARAMGWFYFLPMIGALIVRAVMRGDKRILEKALSLLSMVGIAAIITIITATGRDSLLKVGALLLVTSLLHNVAGYVLGYGVSWLAGMPEKDRRTVAFEVGMQNGGLASGLAVNMGKAATVGLAPAIFGPLMNVTGSILASWWRGRPVKAENEGPQAAPVAAVIND